MAFQRTVPESQGPQATTTPGRPEDGDQERHGHFGAVKEQTLQRLHMAQGLDQSFHTLPTTPQSEIAKINVLEVRVVGCSIILCRRKGAGDLGDGIPRQLVRGEIQVS